MFHLIETVKVFGGQFQNIHRHNNRLNRCRRELFGCNADMDISNEVDIPAYLNNGVYKCRILYSEGIDQVAFMTYVIPKIQAVRIVYDDDIDYRYKYADRTAIDRLYANRFPCDDVLIVKNGLITDTSYCNIVLSDGEKYYTPAMPLLEGTKRQQLLDEGTIDKQSIDVGDLKYFKTMHLINAMIGLEDNVFLNVQKIYDIVS